MSALARYRTLPRSQRILWIVGPLTLLLGTALAIWFGLASTMGKPLWTNVGYDIRDGRHVVVSYQLTRPTDRTVVCAVEARELSHAIVGRVEDVVPPGGEPRLTRHIEVRTSARPVAGEVTQCRVR
ncbi:DUF4307 domain-containing protein [Mobilicoccus pelagius]|uniref:DUF4307 domain-containing protein n=1 Tax=Mobilicoccus pelagius NBRC 104925 TaxID=1089455 RepID=H5USB2_9MICO|nr:DUF4307 domain-containing protein [Mobilicoccus pelagius]GAB48620.1 hypothetical protein MOPEL_078_00090 [Mobilicoccus pelagius NBRC 104925]